MNLNDSQFNLLDKISKIDFCQKWTELNSSFDIELTFTWLDWRIMDLLQSNLDFETNDISEKKLLQVGFNIIPGGRSML